ncbi:class I SAM-dependent methyltransferase [Micromonospora sp. WMMD882]|uniref:class I SAM-dependent methyltransferase n=1 Tax=Micromonospora sp. WMMD882 TaxID=3015151 RepID=UPI00248CF45A|nr:class I SAM-dependent methyltransferase [Micromonospora sp. WMMD882]WBB82348.1 class I SAM-dependent methyltransferase [Micromonospora sp. WMMD882]
MATGAVNYHRWLTDLALPYLGDNPIEVGSGFGDYAQRWLDEGVPAITVGDAEPSRLTALHQRFDADERVEVLGLDLFDPPERQHSALVSFNVLEHIPDHVNALAAAHTLLRPGGRVIKFVPAFQFALGHFDRQVGHVRRYTKASLRQAYEEAGLVVDRLHYVNAPGLLAWTVGMKMLRMIPGDGPLLRVWDKVVVPTARAAERVTRPPFGQSVFAVGHVPADGEASRPGGNPTR